MNDAKGMPMPMALKNRTEERSCGDCRLCCKVLSIDERRSQGGPGFEEIDGKLEFHKRPGDWCQFAGSGGCSVYFEKPGSCSLFQCLWLQGAMDEDDRPDRTKVVLTAEHTENLGNLIIVYESDPGRVKKNRKVKKWLDGAWRSDAVDGIAIIPSATAPRMLNHKKHGAQQAIPLADQFTPEELTVDVDAELEDIDE
ncbi:MAG: hypothetical protein WBG86_17910 [Polyangiales bacterium]